MHDQCKALKSSWNNPPPPDSINKVPSTKLVPDAKKIGDCCLKKSSNWKFSGCAVVRTLHFCCQWPRYDPWLGNEDPEGRVAWPKTKKNKNKTEILWLIVFHKTVLPWILLSPPRPLKQVLILTVSSVVKTTLYSVSLPCCKGRGSGKDSRWQMKWAAFRKANKKKKKS